MDDEPPLNSAPALPSLALQARGYANGMETAPPVLVADPQISILRGPIVASRCSVASTTCTAVAGVRAHC